MAAAQPQVGLLGDPPVARPWVDSSLARLAEPPSLEFIPRITSLPAPPSDIEQLPDQGTFRTLANGDVEEVGTMFNPRTVRNESYVEVWRRMGLRSCHGGEGVHPGSLLVERSDPGDGVHAFVGYIGQFALGIARIASGDRTGFIAWRDEFDFDEGAWRRVVSIGEEAALERYVPPIGSFLPDGPHGRLPSGNRNIIVDGREWAVLFSSE